MIYAKLNKDYYVEFAREESVNLIDFKSLLGYASWAGNVPTGMVQVKDGIVLVEEGGNIELLINANKPNSKNVLKKWQ
ncbi:hypothetical protein [uncultured Clostridium sp.]|uniref:hypothetical protein n=1 Tax=uncultured Clostridium sp. TaxID=59620 RepID=UPI0028E730D7|nr:hypothetical protein [uncultured Clostridium sp.]